jgi:hypothetical protein
MNDEGRRAWVCDRHNYSQEGSKEARAMKKQSRLTGLVLTFLGSMVLLSGLDQPRVAALHIPDIMRLVAGGAGLGIGLFGLIGRLNMSSSDNSAKDHSKGSV